MPVTAEDRVKTRLATEATLATKASKTAGTAATKARAAFAKAVEAVAKATVELDSQAKRDKALAAHKAQGKALTALARACAECERADAAVATLNDPKELTRRVKIAEAIDKKREQDSDGEPLSGTAAAEVVLLNAGTALHYTEITRVALETGIVKLSGKTPDATMSAYLAKATKAGDTFVRVGPGVFDLKSRATTAAE